MTTQTDMIISEMYSRPSLASSTASRIETGAKHMQQCRISLSHMLNFLDGNDEEMCKHKELYCLHKDELAVGVGESLLKNSPTFSRSVYPLVVSTMGTLNPVALLYKAYNFYNTFALNEHIGEICAGVIDEYLADHSKGHTKDDADRVRRCFVDMRSVGVTTTMGYAHHNSGDTMSTVMIMGLHTTMNGAYPVETGDEIMWYWDFENDVLDARTGQRIVPNDYCLDGNMVSYKGRRYNTHHEGNLAKIKEFLTDELDGTSGDYKPTGRLDGGFKPDKEALPHADKRRRFHDRQQVMGKKPIARVKPFVFDRNGSHPDCRRVFAVALSSARPYEMVDIKISRQSL